VELEERVAELERRVAVLERAPEAATAGALWVLERLRAEAERAGAVLYAGTVRLPDGERYEWQYAEPVDGLLAADWSDAAGAFAALGHPVRMRLLREILGGRRAVAELVALDGLGTTGQIYHHVRQLSAAGWLRATERGRFAVPPERVVPLLVALAVARPGPAGA
jgi:hypothetical protein